MKGACISHLGKAADSSKGLVAVPLTSLRASTIRNDLCLQTAVVQHGVHLQENCSVDMNSKLYNLDCIFCIQNFLIDCYVCL
jgi:hypothetical protein